MRHYAEEDLQRVARADFALWGWRSVQFAKDQVPCERYGFVAAAFGGGCDFRARDAVTGRLAPGAICITSDLDNLVCTSCTSADLTGPVAHQRHLLQYPGVHAGREVIVYGYADEAGVFIRLPEPRAIELTPDEQREFYRA